MISLAKYSKIKDNYCICYFGNCHEYLVQINLLQSAIVRRFPELHIYISCRDEYVNLLQGSNIIPISLLKSQKENFAYVKEIRFDNSEHHPVEKFMKDSDVHDLCVNNKLNEEYTVKCVLITKGVYPTKSLMHDQMLKAERRIIDEGYEMDINGCVDNAGWVIGVESADLYKSGAQGIRTTLIPTGIGTNLYKKMFPVGEIWRI